MAPVRTLTDCYPLLTRKDKLILCGVINTRDATLKDVSPATLPFVPFDTALRHLRAAYSVTTADSPVGRRAYRELIQRLEFILGAPKPGSITVTRRLNDGKVAKWFGPHPEMGKAINGHVKRVTAGMKNTFGRLSPNEDVLVPPMVALSCTAKGTWRVTCESKFLAEVDRFLVDHCI